MRFGMPVGRGISNALEVIEQIISYHFIDKPELVGQFDQATLEALNP
jgi:hypothetical protein